MIHGKELIGKRFGRLVVIQHVSGKAKTKSRFLCLCDCGRKKELGGSYLPYGRALSCGCGRPHEAKDNGLTKAFNTYRKHAKFRNLVFELTKEMFSKLILEKCFYCEKKDSCKTSLQRSKYLGDRFFLHNGIDRLDNLKGYTIENSVPCCKLCNHMKWNLSFKDWIDHIKIVLANQQPALVG
jgi:hypothetical protein